MGGAPSSYRTPSLYHIGIHKWTQGVTVTATVSLFVAYAWLMVSTYNVLYVTITVEGEAPHAGSGEASATRNRVQIWTISGKTDQSDKHDHSFLCAILCDTHAAFQHD